MSHNTLPPSKYGTGTTYEGDGTIKHIIPAAEHESETYKIPVTMPRIVRVSGAIAVEESVMPSVSYRSPNERQQALDIAEDNNIIQAAKAAGVSVDYWKNNRDKFR